MDLNGKVENDVSEQEVFEKNEKVFTDGISPEKVAEFYNKWAHVYDKELLSEGIYLAPQYVADTLASLFTTNRESVKVLDVAAGSGLMGEKLHTYGFRKIDGLDPSQGMLDICSRKNVYSRLFCDFMTENPTTAIQKGTYDCVGVSGAMGPSHIPRGALREMIRITKSDRSYTMDKESEKDQQTFKAHEDNAKVFQNNLSPYDVQNYYTTWAPDYEQGFHIKRFYLRPSCMPRTLYVFYKDRQSNVRVLDVVDGTDIMRENIPGFHIDGFYLGPSYVAQALYDVYKDRPSTVKVLDVAAGTGILGEKLQELGFRKIDGLDPSEGMLDICRRKNIYSKLICDFMTEKPSDIPNDTYDCLGISGGMGPGHIPRKALKEMIRIIKPGGYICIAIREEYIEMSEEYNNNKLEDFIHQLERDGLWKKVVLRVVDNYVYGKPGVLFLYTVL